MTQLNCIIVDDDEIDRLTVTSFVKRYSNFIISGICTNAEEALSILKTKDIDILFLDIDMPGSNGIELRKKTQHIPVCIYITSHPEHAVESFHLDTLDYILKPLNLDRFLETVKRIEEFMEVRQKASLYDFSLGSDVIYIKEGHDNIKVKLHEIIYLEALKDYTLIITEKKRHCVLLNLGNLLRTEHFGSFVRVHRSFAVQKQRINRFTPTEIEMDNETKIPIGNSFRDNLFLLT